jgi:hypothetical protein
VVKKNIGRWGLAQRFESVSRQEGDRFTKSEEELEKVAESGGKS